MIFRVCVWFSPFQAPISTEVMADRIKTWWLISSWYCIRMDSGATFCHVRRIRPGLSLTPCVTSGSHEWKGARPSLIAREIKAVVIMMLLVSGWKTHSPSCLKFIMIASRSSIEAVACVRKYFVAASVERGLG